MKQVISHDSTPIAFDQTGNGPTVILVGGAFNTRTFGPNSDLVPLLAEQFSVINYDRRGRGDSGDTKPYAVEREIEDIDALIDQVGEPVYLYGISSGAALALMAANRLSGKIKRLAVYEAPFVVDASRKHVPSDFAPHLAALVKADQGGEAIRYFMTQGVGLPGIFVLMMRLMPAWAQLKSVAHTAYYDALLLGDNAGGKKLAGDQWRNVSMATLVMDGGKSPAWMRTAMHALATTLPNATHRTLEGQMHVVSAAAMAPALADFFNKN